MAPPFYAILPPGSAGRGTMTRVTERSDITTGHRRDSLVGISDGHGADGHGADRPGADAPQDSAPDDNEVIEAILLASRAMVGIAMRTLSEAGEDVTLPQYRTLVALGGGARRLADLAEVLGVSPSTATRMCDRLVRKGLITRTRDAFDRREVNLEVTPAGQATVIGVITRRRSEVCALLTSIPRGTRRDLVDALHLLSVATGDAPELHWMPGWHE
ncbi:MAG: MarR family winged helix-turn-helix transcriptional regulator [Acidimicrobiales bacterium]